MLADKYLIAMASTFLLAILGACGGSVADSAMPNGPSTGGVAVNTVLGGVYVASMEGKEFVSVVTPELNWYALYFERLAHTNPDIFSGQLRLGLGGLATVVDLKAFQIAKSALPLSGSATITAGTLNNYRVSVTGITSAQGNALTFSADALSPNTYSLVRTAQLSDIQGAPAWQGSWYDGDTSNNSPLQFSANGTVSSIAALNYCDLSTLVLTPMNGVNLFKVSLSVPVIGSGGICLRTKDHPAGINFSGVAVVYTSPLPGKTWRLDLIAIDSAGSGISFRGDR